MANKKAVLGRPLPDASVARNAFDRSSMREYHTALGQLTPVWWEPVIAGSHCKLNRKIFQRTADVNTAAFPILDNHIQYYFVPMRQMWSYWENFKLGIQDINSTALASSNAPAATGVDIPTQVPYTTLSNILQALNNFTNNNVVDAVGIQVRPFAEKLLNYLGYGQEAIAGTETMQVNLWPILAYHKIYYDHFRNTAYEPNRPITYNLDYVWTRNSMNSISAGDLTGAIIGTAAENGLLTPHYVNYRDDYFTNMYPSLNYVQSVPTGSGWLIPSNVNAVPANVANSFFAGVFGDVNSLSPAILQNNDSTVQSNTRISVNAIRSLFAIDKLQRSSAYAPKHIKNQYEARFGIKFPDKRTESDFIGAFMNGIQIGEVTSTATTDYTSGGQTATQPLGTIGGKGVGFDDWGKTLTYDAKEDGIIMAVQYSTVRSSYRSYGLDSYLTKFLKEDYFQPEYQDLGLEPVYGYEYNRLLGSSIVMGYRPRNQRYKLGIDKNYGLFSDMNSDMSMFINHTDIGRIPSGSGLNYGWFKVQPTDLNGIMRVDFDGTWATDQFITQCEFGFTCVQNMSVHGQPKL